MKYSERPVTQNMLDQLKRALAKENSTTENNICVPEDFKGTLSGLYKRGLINTTRVKMNGKDLMKVYLTEEGINFLNSLE